MDTTVKGRAEQRLTEIISDEATAAGMSTLRLSEETGIPRTTLNRRFTTGRGFDAEELFAVANALGKPLSTLIKKAEEGGTNG